MSKLTIGILFIVFGLVYGSLAFDWVNRHTLGVLINYGFVKPSPPGKNKENEQFGGKPAIILYSLILICFGIYLIWKRNT